MSEEREIEETEEDSVAVEKLSFKSLVNSLRKFMNFLRPFNFQFSVSFIF